MLGIFRRFSLSFWVIVSCALVILSFNAFYIVDQREYAVVFMFGKPVRSEKTPGLKFKIPFLHDVIFFDNRVQNIVFSPQGDNREVMAIDQKTMKLDAFTKYRIVNPLLFYQKVRTEANFQRNIGPIIESSIREVVGTVPFLDVLGKKRDYVVTKINEMTKAQAKMFGVDIIDVRILRVNLPDKAKNAVYARMRTDREKEAREIRATGAEEARKIRAVAERDKAVMLANATSEAEKISGKGEAAATEIFAKAAEGDVDFFTFYRTMQSYDKALGADNTYVVLSTQSDFLRYLGSSANAAKSHND